MTVKCNKEKVCPNGLCIHRVEHDPKYIGGSERWIVPITCATKKLTCPGFEDVICEVQDG
jgi:hypothetical protein